MFKAQSMASPQVNISINQDTEEDNQNDTEMKDNQNDIKKKDNQQVEDIKSNPNKQTEVLQEQEANDINNLKDIPIVANLTKNNDNNNNNNTNNENTIENAQNNISNSNLQNNMIENDISSDSNKKLNQMQVDEKDKADEVVKDDEEVTEEHQQQISEGMSLDDWDPIEALLSLRNADCTEKDVADSTGNDNLFNIYKSLTFINVFYIKFVNVTNEFVTTALGKRVNKESSEKTRRISNQSRLKTRMDSSSSASKSKLSNTNSSSSVSKSKSPNTISLYSASKSKLSNSNSSSSTSKTTRKSKIIRSQAANSSSNKRQTGIFPYLLINSNNISSLFESDFEGNRNCNNPIAPTSPLHKGSLKPSNMSSTPLRNYTQNRNNLVVSTQNGTSLALRITPDQKINHKLFEQVLQDVADVVKTQTISQLSDIVNNIDFSLRTYFTTKINQVKTQINKNIDQINYNHQDIMVNQQNIENNQQNIINNEQNIINNQQNIINNQKIKPRFGANASNKLNESARNISSNTSSSTTSSHTLSRESEEKCVKSKTQIKRDKIAACAEELPNNINEVPEVGWKVFKLSS